MRVVVDSLQGPMKRALYLACWRVDRTKWDGSRSLPCALYEAISGQCMVKDFECLGDAMREFEKLTDIDVISETDQDGCPIFTFFCYEQQLVVSGWDCGKWLYDRWCQTPRACLEALNA